MLEETQAALGALLGRSVQAFDLSQPLENGMPCSPSHPGFHMALMRRHGDLMRGAGSGSNEIITFGGHVGTHVDALAHVAAHGQLHGGIDAVANSVGGRHRQLGAETIPPTLCRGRLLDIPRVLGQGRLLAGYGVTVDDLQAAAGTTPIEPGDVVLVRTGWPQVYHESETYIGHREGAPGVTGPAAEWLANHGVRAVGSDTIAFDQILPGLGHSQMPAHHILLVQRGIHIIEVLNLEELAEHGAAEFWFLMIPLRLVGATGSPVRPLAIVDPTSLETSR
ncbi:Kynurenine formamidase [Thermomonospora echinospora]|uniref:Kynurenine formamidase n=1 Tax=Thermomonospora echinospora TaxID=1992 RepID=A0A1H6E6C3_9ACTN|nr:cyclase family protein [Thermomonospora echinospora]SEG92803.1 Kynurenine formamidase [Thermomonospora echinospora]